MSRPRLLTLLVAGAALLAGCTREAVGQPLAAPSPRTSIVAATTPETTAPETTTPTTTRPPSRTPVLKVVAACPLLSADELKQLLGGGSSSTSVTAFEDAPDTSYGSTTYTCEYGSAGKKPFALAVTDLGPVSGFSPSEAVNAVAKTHTRNTRVTGVGDAAVFCVLSDGNSLLAAAKASRGETRLVAFVAPSVVPEQKFIDVQKVVLDRL